jgi:Cu2+-exporting ATPase
VLSAVAAAPGTDEAEVLAVAAGVERASVHPLGRAIVRGAEKRGIAAAAATEVESVAGGARATVDGSPVHVGGRRLLEALGLEPPAALAAVTSGWADAGRTVITVIRDGRVIGAIGIGRDSRGTTSAP